MQSKFLLKKVTAVVMFHLEMFMNCPLHRFGIKNLLSAYNLYCWSLVMKFKSSNDSDP